MDRSMASDPEEEESVASNAMQCKHQAAGNAGSNGTDLPASFIRLYLLLT
uniref:Uncharacterized protein n=1 Tax=Setaria italica TaxID=4555 RepID=K3YP00_SETIT